MSDAVLIIAASPHTMGASLMKKAWHLYGARRFEQCYGVTSKLTKAFPTYGEARILLEKVVRRVLEERTGKYNFEEMLRSNRINQSVVDAANYIGPVEIRPSELHGRGLFATENVKAGELLLCEKAFAFYNAVKHGEGERGVIHTDLFKQACLQLVHKSPAAKLFAKYRGNDVTGLDGVMTPNAVLKAILKYRTNVQSSTLCELRRNNAFPASSSSAITSDLDLVEDIYSIGHWIHKSFINHSCVPNCIYSSIGDMIIIRATKDITVGSEITTTYLIPLYEENMNERLHENWNFWCTCAFCQEEKEPIDPEAKQERDKLLARWEYFTDCSNDEMVASLPSSWIQGFAQRLSRTYPLLPSTYPRFEVWKRRIRMVEVFVNLNQPWNTAREAGLALQSVGYEVSYRAGMDIVVLRWGFPAPGTVGAWVALWTSFAWSSDNDSASQLSDFAKKAYVILVGEDVTFEETFGIPARKAISEGKIWCGL